MLNWRGLCKILALLNLMLGVFLCVPLLVALGYNEETWKAFALTLGVVAGVSGFLGLIARGSDQQFSTRDSMMAVTLIWVLFTAQGAIPLWYATDLSYTDCFFETMSGLSTTGASVIADIEGLDRGILFWRQFTVWIGGLGIVVMALFLLPAFGKSGFTLFKAEASGVTKEKSAPKLSSMLKVLFGIYVVLTVLGTLAFYWVGSSWYDAWCHTFAALGTGGMGTRNDSFVSLSAAEQWVAVGIMVIAATNFALHYDFVRGRPGAYRKDSEFRVYLGVMLVACVLVTCELLVRGEGNVSKTIRDAVFQVVSLMTCTGFVSADYEKWPAFSQWILFMLLFINGSSGSTTGGIKVIRILILVKHSLYELRKALRPRVIEHIRVGETVVREDVSSKVMAFFFLYISSIFVLTAVVCLGGEIRPWDALTAVTTCMGGIGPGWGMVGPMTNFSGVSDLGTWTLSFAMLLGRLELFTVLVLLTRTFWRA